MTVSNGQYLKTLYDTTKALGEKAISSDAMIEFEGYESMAFAVKGFPWPVLTSGGEIEVPMPLGMAQQIPQQAKINQQGQVQMQETTAGSVSNMLLSMVAAGAKFNGKVYEGTTTLYRRYHVIKDCFLQCEPGERDWENRGSIVVLSGTLFYHYFGEIVPGNIT
jgi:hypothetical protein